MRFSKELKHDAAAADAAIDVSAALDGTKPIVDTIRQVLRQPALLAAAENVPPNQACKLSHHPI